MISAKELIKVLKQIDEDTHIFYESDETFFEPSCVRVDFDGDLILYNSDSDSRLTPKDEVLIKK